MRRKADPNPSVLLCAPAGSEAAERALFETCYRQVLRDQLSTMPPSFERFSNSDGRSVYAVAEEERAWGVWRAARGARVAAGFARKG